MKLAHVGTALLVSIATVIVPTTASADSYVRSDPSGDVVKAVFDPDGTVRQPGRKDGDIVASGVSHGPRRVHVALRMRDIGRSGGRETISASRFRRKKRVREVTLTADPRSGQGHVNVYNRRGNNAPCRGVRWSISYPDDLVTLSIPRRCLGRPGWVRVGMGVANLVGHEPDLYSDDAMTNGVDHDPVVYGPRVYR